MIRSLLAIITFVFSFYTSNAQWITTGNDAVLNTSGNVRIPDSGTSFFQKKANTTSTLFQTSRTDDTFITTLNTNGWGDLSVNNSFGVGYPLTSPGPGYGSGNLFVSGHVGVGTTLPVSTTYENLVGFHPVKLDLSGGSYHVTGSGGLFIGDELNTGIGGGHFVYDATGNSLIVDGVKQGIASPNLSILPGGGNVGIGTNDTRGFKLAVNGSMIATSVQVMLHGSWPDYVFKPTYRLKPLSEVKAYIAQNQHLPEMPSAADVEKNGLNLGEINKLLTKKVEELTLYLIEKDKEKNEQDAKLKILQNQMIAMQKQINAVTKIIAKK